MEGIPTDFAPKEPAAEEEWERFYENLVQDFMEQNYGGIVSQVDITVPPHAHRLGCLCRRV